MSAFDLPSETVVPPAKPFFAMLEVTACCNSRCDYCSCWQPSSPSASLSAAQCQELIPSLHTLGVRRLILTGGEPLLNRDLPHIINTAYQNRIHTSVVTNGIALTRRRYEMLVQAGMLGLTLSLDTLDATTYRALRGVPVDFAMKAVHILEHATAKDRVSTSINCVMTALNYRQVKDLVLFADKRGIPVMIQPCNTDRNPQLAHLLPRPEEMGQVEQVIRELIAMKTQGVRILSSETFLQNMIQYWVGGSVPPVKQCLYGHITVTIRHTGAVCPCWRLPVVGQTGEQTIEMIWHSGLFESWREKMILGKCPGCWLACSYDWQTLWASEEQVNQFWEQRLTSS